MVGVKTAKNYVVKTMVLKMDGENFQAKYYTVSAQ